MLFSQRDMAILRLLYWCQYIRPEDLCRVAPEVELSNLVSLGLVKQHRTSGAYALTNKGHLFLRSIFSDAVPALAESYHKDAISRRLRVAGVAVTAYRAGVQIFTTSMEDLSSSPSLFLSAITRSRGSNPWGSTRVAALAHLGDLICSIHYVCPGIGKVALTDELTAFGNQAAPYRMLQRGVIFAGSSYQDILTELAAPRPEKETKLIPYGEVYRCLGLPVYLLACDDTGAMQLRLMSMPQYRQRLTQAALKSQYRPPPEDLPGLDAIFQGMPFVMAADMNLRRIDAALKSAYERGYPQIAMAALEGQAETVLFARYRDTGKARVFILTNAALTEVLGGPPQLHAPSQMQFLTKKGEVVDAPFIQTNRKIGGAR